MKKQKKLLSMLVALVMVVTSFKTQAAQFSGRNERLSH